MNNELRKYRAKRNFDKTAEPSGIEDAEIQPSEHLRFVVQKHAARRLHYDLRLESDGVFHSWAVARGPSLDPSQKRLAVEVETHPLAYGDFEGTIPKGEYGGGTVMVWDRGFWALEKSEAFSDAFERGEIKFVLAGEKLQGSWALVRMKDDGKSQRHNWLLLKHRDEWATPGTDTILDQDLSVASGRTLKQIEAGKGSAPRAFITSGARISPEMEWRSSRPTGSSAQRGSTLRRKVTAPRLTNENRVLWPDSGLTKSDLANYLVEASQWMVAHLAGRPCSLLRAPEGIEGETFFQRHAGAGLPEGIVEVKIADDRQPFLEIDDAQTLADLAQYSAIEFHPWNCVAFNPKLPGRLVFDLDPGPGVTFDQIISAARDIRHKLENLGLSAFCKTSGGKGLHVVSPLRNDGETSWQQAKLFAHTLAAQLSASSPDKFVATMSKRVRKGRIFIDYMRNDEKATAVAPLSPRARPGAYVSMPLNWTQVRKGLEPSRFTILDAVRQLEKSDAWNGYERARQPLGPAINAMLERA